MATDRDRLMLIRNKKIESVKIRVDLWLICLLSVPPPLHHHFEMVGWKESKIVFRFVILAILFALLSLSTLKLR